LTTARRLTLLRLLLLLTLFVALPTVGGADSLETRLEKFIGDLVARGLRDGSGVDNDPLLKNWIQGMGAKVSAVAPRRDVKYTFTILGTDAPNALAGPGGHIFVTRGLLDAVESDDELAVVLAHESGHVSKKHAMAQIGENALFLLGMFIFGDEMPATVRTGVIVANVLRTLSRSRHMEAQADDEGLRYAYESGYDSGGLIHFFEGFDLRKRSSLEEYFATHPSPEKRIEAARKSPYVVRNDATIRETTAKGYENRGLLTAAKQVRAGQDPLKLPPVPPVALSPELQSEREEVRKDAESLRKSLRGSVGAQKFGNTLQTVMLVNSQSDPRWLYIAARAYTVQTNVEDLLARTSRIANTAPGTYDALARYADGHAGEAAVFESALGRSEVRKALDRAKGAPTPIQRAARAVAVVLTDLNNRFYQPKGEAAWARYGSLEGLLRYAESELSRADKMSGQAWRFMAMARIRRYQERLTELIPENDTARRARWSDLARRRLGVTFPMDGPTGSATVRAALALELGVEPLELDARRGSMTWADFALKNKGIPENIATVIRLLTLDLERETLTMGAAGTAGASD
jgi:Zn-dependent protease with chaperone function